MVVEIPCLAAWNSHQARLDVGGRSSFPEPGLATEALPSPGRDGASPTGDNAAVLNHLPGPLPCRRSASS